MVTNTSFVARVLANWAEHPAKTFVHEMDGAEARPTRGGALLEQTQRFRAGMRALGVKKSDRVVVIGNNSATWIALDFAILAEGAVPTAMYVRQSDAELEIMIRDSEPQLVVLDDGTGSARAERLQTLLSQLPTAGAARTVVTMEALRTTPATSVESDAAVVGAEHPVSIIYTSGTSGQPKGVVTTSANIEYMLPQLDHELSQMTGRAGGEDRVFHYLPFCFAGSRMLLWTCMLRNNPIWLSTNLDNLKDEIAGAAPQYFLNVPTLLERIRAGVETQIQKGSTPIRLLYQRAVASRTTEGGGTALDNASRRLVETLILPKIRAKIGPNLQTLICGSAPLSPDTQAWFQWIGIDVYQVYGLTETTAIVSMDRAHQIEKGRVGLALAQVEVRFGEQDELQVKGPNIFAGYFRNEVATREAFTADGYFRTGDQASMDARGRIAITGRVKNLLVLESGHNVAPEPLETKIVADVPSIEHAVVVGHGKPHLVALISTRAGQELDRQALGACIDSINAGLPHYKRIRAWKETGEALTPENGMLTANTKLRRKVIEERFATLISGMYRDLASSENKGKKAETQTSISA